MSPARRPALVGGLVGALTGIVVLNAVLLPGYTWAYDMVFVPDLPWSDRILGVDGSVPRAVPTDAVVALLERALPGDVVQALLLWLVFVVVGAGCGRLCRTGPGAAAAALAAGWNPYVVERLSVGHWAFLLGYACLPWIHAAAGRAVRREPGGTVALAGWLALASLAGSTAAVLAGIVAVASLTTTRTEHPVRGLRGRAVGSVAILLTVFNAAWIVPSLTRTNGLLVDPGGVEAFRARAESAAGVLPSLLSLGGIWHQPSVPGSRTGAVVVVVSLVVAVGVLAICVRRGLARELAPLLVAGGAGLLIACAAALPGGRHVVESVLDAAPGLGIVRDAQKFVAPLAVLLAVASGRAVDVVAPIGRAPGPARSQRWIVAAALAIAPVVTLPDAPFAAGRSLGSVALPDDIAAARHHLDDLPPGGVAVFPWTQYRRFGWNDDRISLDPWNRLLDRDVVVNDDLPLTSGTVRGEDEVAARVSRVLADPDGDVRGTLRGAGVRWAVLLTDQPGARRSAERLGAGAEDRRFGAVRVIDLGPVSARGSQRSSLVPLAVTVLTTGGAVLAWALLGLRARAGIRRRRDAMTATPHG